MSKLLSTTVQKFTFSEIKVASTMSKRSGFHKAPRFKPEMKAASAQSKLGNMLLNRKEKVEILSEPIKSESDKKVYKTIKLENGLTALLISDMSRPPADNESSEEESESSSEEGSGTDSDGSNVSDTSDKHGVLAQNDFNDEKLAACALCVGVGSFSDPREIQGLAHFVEHMVFMGSAKYPKENEFDAFIKKKGGTDNASTDCELTTYYFEIAEKYLAQAMDIFSQFFVSPLMKKEAMQREREAIESEFAIAYPSDSNRKDQLLSSLFPPLHPASTFTWGNLKSLKEDLNNDDMLHEAAHQFRNRHYSAHRMTLAVQARMDLPKLEQYVTNTFGLIPTNNQPADNFTQYNFTPSQLTNFTGLFYVKPVTETIEVQLTWCMRSLIKDYESKPQEYISHLLGHEGSGSLMSYLKKKVWALGIYTGTSGNGIDYTSLYSLFSARIVLTKEGIKNLDSVIEATFSYINMLKELEPNERIFKELQAIAETRFRFEDEVQAVENVETMAENMQYFPPEHYITGDSLYYKYDPKGISELLDYMKPEFTNVMVLSNKYEPPLEYNGKEPWFGTEYRREEIPKPWLERWQTVKPFEAFNLPEPNIYITTDFSLIKQPDGSLGPSAGALIKDLSGRLVEKSGDKKAGYYFCQRLSLAVQRGNVASLLGTIPDGTTLDKPYLELAEKLDIDLEKDSARDIYRKVEASAISSQTLKQDDLIATINHFRLDQPNLLRKNNYMEVWYKPDFRFRLPTALLYLYFITPLTLKSPRESVLLDIWNDVLHHELKEQVYPANMAGLGHSMFVADKGLALKVKGYNQNIHLVIDEITKTMRVSAHKLLPEFLAAVKTIKSCIYHNSLLKPQKLAKDIRLDVLLEPYISLRDKIHELDSITAEELADFSERFLDNLYLQILVQGNMQWYEALSISDQVLKNIKWESMPTSLQPRFLVHQIPLGTHVLRVNSFNPASTNSILINYYQAEATDLNTTAVIEVLMMLADEPVFDTLRTKEQLGYSVSSMMRYTFGVLGYSITIISQIDKFTVQHVDKRIEAFLMKFSRDIKRLSEKKLASTKQTLLQLKHTTDYELSDEMERNWREIITLDYNFHRIFKEAAAIEAVTLSDMKTFAEDHFSTGNLSKYRKLSVQVVGHKQQNTTGAPTEREFSLTYHTGDTDGDANTTYITNIKEFKKKLSYIQVPTVELKQC